MTKNVIVYIAEGCRYCHMAQDLLKEKGLEFEVIDITNDQQMRSLVMEKANGRKTVPQIFVDDFHVGGFDDLKKLENSGELEGLLS